MGQSMRVQTRRLMIGIQRTPLLNFDLFGVSLRRYQPDRGKSSWRCFLTSCSSVRLLAARPLGQARRVDIIGDGLPITWSLRNQLNTTPLSYSGRVLTRF